MKSIVRANAEKDPTYNPYCGRCPGFVRMKRVEPFLWNCHCGAVHDERKLTFSQWRFLLKAEKAGECVAETGHERNMAEKLVSLGCLKLVETVGHLRFYSVTDFGRIQLKRETK